MSACFYSELISDDSGSHKIWIEKNSKIKFVCVAVKWILKFKTVVLGFFLVLSLFVLAEVL